MRLIVAGGGTGGHLFPALSIARAVTALAPESQVLFVGTEQGIEARIVPQTEFPIRFITARGLRGTGFLNKLRGAVELPKGVLESIRILREFKPHVVLGVGGYASAPTLAAAILMRIPAAIQEQNSVMGTTNRILSRFVGRVFVAWEHTEPTPSPEKTILAGNPVRADLLHSTVPEIKDDRFHLLVFGGSQGARSINHAVAGNLDVLAAAPDRVAVMHQTGKAFVDEVRQMYEEAGIEADVRDFIDEMGAAYRWADLVVCRAGASSLAEITALGKPAVVVPYPYAIGDHQAKNAAVLEKQGAVRIVREENLKNGALMNEVRSLMNDRDALRAMAEKSRRAGRPNAAEVIARDLLKAERSGD
ncbi:MAG: undecaprenyldiphospho-muramoylpentapeptide beta-N-acetylglucosaminyltransferase [Desulfomonile sp.]|nr:undecaprenyldiphospho-muramoylpentapeptide beta-N-acetylglucosaminyltransferase [Desulfomonile sp.]